MQMQKTKTTLLISFLPLFVSIDVLNAFELTPGKGALEASRKILCSTIDDKPIVYWWYGRMYSRVQGERDKRRVEDGDVEFDTNGANTPFDMPAALEASKSILVFQPSNESVSILRQELTQIRDLLFEARS